MKRLQKALSLLLCLALLCGFALTANAAGSNAYLSNRRWIETTKSAIEQKYSNGDKFIVDFYRTDCTNSQNVGTNVITPWMDDYGYTVYGVNADTQGIPSWGWTAAGTNSVALPLVCFVNNKSVTAWYGAEKTATDNMKSTFFSFTGNTPVETPINTFSYPVTYHQTEARTMLGKINALRTGRNAWYWNSDNATKTVRTGLSALQYDYELEKAAMQRAAELVAVYSHTRPNNGKADEMFSWTSYGENIAYGQKTADIVQTVWEEADQPYSGQGHRRNMLNKNFTAVGLACAEYNGCKFWVQEFRSPAGSTTYVAPNDSLTTVSVEILDPYILTNTAIASPSSVTLRIGESTPLPVVTQNITMRGTPGYMLACTGKVSWSGGNTSVARISGSSIVAVGSGTTTFTGTINGKTVSVPVTVSSADTSCTVTYNANGATGGSVPASQIKQKGVALTLAANTGNLTRTGYTLDGWAASASGARAYNLGGTYTANASATLYAHWTANTYTVRFNGNGATGGSMAYQYFTYGVSQTLTANAYQRAYTVTYNYNGATGGVSVSSAKAAATFNGWAASSSGAKVYNDKQSVKNLAAGGTVTLYAGWTLGAVTLPTPTKTGYAFKGWNTKNNGKGTTYAAGASFKPTADVTLYAVWQKNNVTRPHIAIRNDTTDFTVRYATKITLFADVKNAPAGAKVKWYGVYRNNGAEQVTTAELDVDDGAMLVITKDYDIYAELIAGDGTGLATSQTETVHVKPPGIFILIVILFRLFLAKLGIRPKHAQ